MKCIITFNVLVYPAGFLVSWSYWNHFVFDILLFDRILIKFLVRT